MTPKPRLSLKLTPKQRRRHRQKLQAALARVLQVLQQNTELEIVPDKATALVALHVRFCLERFAKACPEWRELPKLLTKATTSDRELFIIKRRFAETAARRARKRRRRR